MPTTLDRAKVKQYLDDFDLRSLFTQELGWDYGGSDTEVTVKDRAYPLQAVAHKRGMVAYQYLAQPGDDFPDHPTRQQIERKPSPRRCGSISSSSPPRPQRPVLALGQTRTGPAGPPAHPYLPIRPEWRTPHPEVGKDCLHPRR